MRCRPLPFFLPPDLGDNTFKSKVIVFSSSKDNSNNLLVFDEGMKKMVDSLFSNTNGKNFAAIFPNKQIFYLNEGEVQNLPEVSKDRMKVVIQHTAHVNHNKCYGKKEGEITIIASNGTAPYRYKWNNGETTAFIKNLSEGSYYCTITDDKGNESATDTIRLNSPPKFTINTEEILKDKSGIYDVKTLITGGLPPQYFLWKKDSVTIAKTQNLQNVETGNYTLNIWDEIGCKHEADIAIGYVKGNEDKIFEGAIDVFPNPSNGKMTVNIDGTYPSLEIEITDNLGRIISKSQFFDKNYLDLSYLNDGFYSIKFKTSKSTITKKIIIQK